MFLFVLCRPARRYLLLGAESICGQRFSANDFYHEAKSETESAYFVIKSPNESFMKQLLLTKGVT